MTEYNIVAQAVVTIIFTLFLMRGVIAFVTDDLKVGRKTNAHSTLNVPYSAFAREWWENNWDRYGQFYTVTYENWPSERIFLTDKKTGIRAYSDAWDIDDNIGDMLTALERAK